MSYISIFIDVGRFRILEVPGGPLSAWKPTKVPEPRCPTPPPRQTHTHTNTERETALLKYFNSAEPFLHSRHTQSASQLHPLITFLCLKSLEYMDTARRILDYVNYLGAKGYVAPPSSLPLPLLTILHLFVCFFLSVM